jgi:hypothetical protein
MSEENQLLLVVVGIDPGKNGALAILDHKSNIIQAVLMPINKVKVIKKGKTRVQREIDLLKVKSILLSYKVETVVIEKQHIYPGQGNKSNETTMKQYGNLIGLLVGLDIRYVEVEASEWQAKYKEIEVDPEVDLMSIKQTKKKSISAVKKLYPGFSLLSSKRCRVPSDALSDSILIARHYFAHISPI